MNRNIFLLYYFILITFIISGCRIRKINAYDSFYNGTKEIIQTKHKADLVNDKSPKKIDNVNENIAQVISLKKVSLLNIQSKKIIDLTKTENLLFQPIQKKHLGNIAIKHNKIKSVIKNSNIPAEKLFKLSAIVFYLGVFIFLIGLIWLIAFHSPMEPLITLSLPFNVMIAGLLVSGLSIVFLLAAFLVMLFSRRKKA